MKSILSNSFLYFWIRYIITLGIPYKKWIREFRLDANSRILDLGCGPSDIIFFVKKNQSPSFYYGLDISGEYLEEAKNQLTKKNIDFKLEVIDLSLIGKDKNIDNKIISYSEMYTLNIATLIGVIHHLSDEAVLNTLNMLYQSKSIQEVFTQDIIANRNPINDFFVKIDRGENVRTFEEYEVLLKKSNWKIKKVFWTTPGLFPIKYIHFNLTK
jgi:SAM-dependent methyltransferase